ncbi:restriction endonuclease subunit S [Stutzerimonas balearica]|uniref:restriction endonuclease subunit S n=1 Tax=Stutzerimonas balearica TaxID=74829 RepID=UPI001F51AB30
MDILSGFAFKSENFNDRGEGLPLVRIRDVVPGVSDTYYSGEYSSEFLLSDGDLLIGMDGDFNRARWNGGQALLNQRVCKVTAKGESLDQGYLYHFLPKALDKIHAETPAVTVKHLSVKGIRAIEIPLPPLPEQKRIAAILDKADAIRRKRQQAIQLADDFLRAVFLDMFGDPVTNPKGWELLPFSAVGTLDRGKSKHRPRNDPALLGGTHPLIQTGEVANSRGYIKDYSATYSDLGLVQSKKWDAGTLCITIAANIAKTGILTFPACFPDSVVGFMPNKHVTVEYVQHWLGFLQKNLEENAPQAAQKNINLEILRALSIPVPPKSEQEKFSSMVAGILAIEGKIVSSSDTLGNAFDALSQKAFSGQL